ncbi:MAG: phosphosulfolactate synthase [Cyclobacteriaceae bacterium]|nr:phosphosulfolactate synthase [Cyclobacteriaceae bacterium]MCB9239040.1 phosphosulfolactate synthase [Flammeovirgaceae bacterium]MCB0498316.1 phosphosulfolactate synthase [Cyclobacteriaceae bacterium]MCO5270762.1 phosphosulfolactate synthase [Cyclobacteriaceae bacterium]MCW5903500.1 phosphosulfolactate synthase [Cyclobacteriaceae bacterium]
MNYTLKNLPERTAKPRQIGFTMAMDKGLSIREAEDLVSISADHIDIIKLGWATSYVTPNLKEKLKVYKDAGIPCYFGGTLFEAFVVRDQFDDYRKVLDKYDMPFAEVSDGSIDLDHDKKLDYISRLSEQVTVLSEVGSKDAEKIIPPYQWIDLMQKELDAGAWKVIGEARESGNVGLFRATGEVRSGLVQEILTKIPFEKIIWEAPQKAQQVWFIKLLGANVNLGNIAPNEVIPLETIRMGLRGDTFLHFLGLEQKRGNNAPPFYTE